MDRMSGRDIVCRQRATETPPLIIFTFSSIPISLLKICTTDSGHHQHQRQHQAGTNTNTNTNANTNTSAGTNTNTNQPIWQIIGNQVVFTEAIGFWLDEMSNDLTVFKFKEKLFTHDAVELKEKILDNSNAYELQMTLP